MITFTSSNNMTIVLLFIIFLTWESVFCYAGLFRTVKNVNITEVQNELCDIPTPYNQIVKCGTHFPPSPTCDWGCYDYAITCPPVTDISNPKPARYFRCFRGVYECGTSDMFTILNYCMQMDNNCDDQNPKSESQFCPPDNDECKNLLASIKIKTSIACTCNAVAVAEEENEENQVEEECRSKSCTLEKNCGKMGLIGKQHDMNRCMCLGGIINLFNSLKIWPKIGVLFQQGVSNIVENQNPTILTTRDRDEFEENATTAATTSTTEDRFIENHPSSTGSNNSNRKHEDDNNDVQYNYLNIFYSDYYNNTNNTNEDDVINNGINSSRRSNANTKITTTTAVNTTDANKDYDTIDITTLELFIYAMCTLILLFLIIIIALTSYYAVTKARRSDSYGLYDYLYD